MPGGSLRPEKTGLAGGAALHRGLLFPVVCLLMP